MADRFYSCVKGVGLPVDVVEAATTQASTIELRVTYSSFAEKIDVLKGIDAIKARIEQGNWKPA